MKEQNELLDATEKLLEILATMGSEMKAFPS
jgi:hypothetical protein